MTHDRPTSSDDDDDDDNVPFRLHLTRCFPSYSLALCAIDHSVTDKHVTTVTFVAIHRRRAIAERDNEPMD